MLKGNKKRINWRSRRRKRRRRGRRGGGKGLEGEPSL
jgi:hypothetical protein